ncbi:PI-PLC X domain-containing protein 2-like [Saccostrea cucullata]|uniref:PI-PLC X domain-containing protein 2-like n=1 Tax=Saccostrea cuccullata TaxID=36930 RepID=UPI002ED683A5
MTAEDSYTTWMADLSPELTRIPVCSLAIPGSHDSGAYWLDKAGEIAEDEPPILRRMAKSCCCVVPIVHRWSLTQNLTVKEQLEHGIRYLDLRLCGRPGSPDVYVAHGLYGNKLEDILMEIKEFLNENPKEFVILDFNHFYNMTSVDHRQVLHQIIGTFDAKILSGDTSMSVWKMTLENLWKTPARVMVFYGHPSRNEFPFFWSEEYIQSPWANTASSSAMVNFHECNYNQNVRRGAGELYV